MALLACACQSGPPPALFVATAQDGEDEVSVALLADGEHVAAYACANDVARDPYPGWFTGNLAADGSFALARGGWTFSGSIGRDGAQGTIAEPDGTLVSWSSGAASHSSLTGVYKDDSDDSACAASVIVIADDPSAPPIVRGAWCNVMQVTPVMPIALVDGRLAVEVPSIEGARRLYVEPVRTVPP